MKKDKNIVIVDQEVAEAINLYKLDKFSTEKGKNNLNYSIDFPVLISNTQNILDKVLEEGRLMEPIFNNIVKNEEEYCSLYLKNKNRKYYTNRLVTEISNSHGFDLKRKIEVFTPNIVEKLIQIFKNQYKKVIEKPIPYEIEIIAKQNNLEYSEVKWVFDQVRQKGVEKSVYGVIDLNLNPNVEDTSVNLNQTFPNGSKVLNTITKLLGSETIDFEVYFSYFARVFGDLYMEIHPFDQKTTSLSNEQKDIYISYLKLLAMRVFEYFDIFKIISVNDQYIN
ncbi:MAG: hypothetical protein K2I49_03370, partial [Ureaplasma sp.]|nr:hypothetical protein [Ureaplasma sp.]